MPRVFISYVRENSKEVTQLIEDLKSREVDVWFDKTHLKPGDRWANVIRREIAQGDFFIACFSTEYSMRPKSYMNEEIIQAIEQLRQRPVGQPWFIPALLSDCEIPDFNIGAGETLRSIHWVTLYENWEEGIRHILKVVHPGYDKVKVVFFDLGDTLVYVNPISRNLTWIPGAQETIKNLQKRYIRLGIISNVGPMTRQKLLEKLPADFDINIFEEKLIILSSEVGISKPDVEIFKLAAKRANIRPEECMYISDNKNDTNAARQIGMKVQQYKSLATSVLGSL